MRLWAEDLAAERGGQILFSGLGFVLRPGQAMAVRGPNGAGKTTLLRVLAGLASPLLGRAGLDGGRVTLPNASHFLAVENAMKPQLTAAENLAFWRRFSPPSDPGTDDGLAVAGALEAVGLAGAAALAFAALSTGQKRRLGLARLLLRRRPVWLLDEPGSGLDDVSHALLEGLVRDHLAGGGIVVAALHGAPPFPVARDLALDGGSG